MIAHVWIALFHASTVALLPPAVSVWEGTFFITNLSASTTLPIALMISSKWMANIASLNPSVRVITTLIYQLESVQLAVLLTNMSITILRHANTAAKQTNTLEWEWYAKIIQLLQLP